MPADVTVDTIRGALAPVIPAGWDWRVDIRPRRKLIGVTVESGGAVVFTVPPGSDPDRVARFARANLTTIAGYLNKARARPPEHPVKDLVGGEGFKLLGTNHRLRLVDDPAAPPIVAGLAPSWSGKSWWLLLRRDHATADTIIGWYRQQGQAFCDQHMPNIASRMGVAGDLTWQVRPFDPRTPRTWATYLAGPHTVRLHWALFQLDREFVRYTLAHEAAHAALRGRRVAPHGREWSTLVDRLHPGHEDLRRRYAADGARVWLGAVNTPTPTRPSCWADLFGAHQ